MFISNLKTYLKASISSTQGVGTTFTVGTDFELGAVIDTGGKTVSFVLKSGTQIERFEVIIARGVATIVRRGIDQLNGVSVGLQKPWLDGSIGYVTTLAFDLVDKQGDDFTGPITTTDISFTGTTTPGLRVKNLTTIQREATTAINGDIVYDTDLEEFMSYKNSNWQPLGTGGGGSAVWYQDSTTDGTITGAINGVNTSYKLSHIPGAVNAVILTYNGQVLERGLGDDYLLSGNSITMNWAPITGRLVAIYPDQGVGTQNATTRATSSTDAVNGELYRSTNDNQSLYYKDNGGDSIKILDINTNKLDSGILDIATQSEAEYGILDTEVMTPLKTKQSINSSILNFGNGSDGDVIITTTITLTRDMFYNNLTITSPGILNPNGYKIFVKGTLSGNGIIRRNGNIGENGQGGTTSVGGTGGIAGTPLNQGTLGISYGGINGATGAYGFNAGGGSTTGNIILNSFINGNNAKGGNGGSCSAGSVGGTGGQNTISTGYLYNITIYDIFTFVAVGLTPVTLYNNIGGGVGGASGASYCNGGSGGGGGGGGAGGIIFIYANIINFTGTIESNGNNGGNAGNSVSTETSASTTAGSGGGAGGNGGLVYVISNSFTNGGVINIKGGNGGNGGNASSSSPGSYTATGGNGGNGGNGGILVIQSKTKSLGTIVNTGGTFGTFGLGTNGGANGSNGIAGTSGNNIIITL